MMRRLSRSHAAAVILLSAALVLYGNAKSAIVGDAPQGGWAGIALGLLLTGLMALYARDLLRLDRAELGLASGRVGRSLRWGFFAALAVLGLTYFEARLALAANLAMGVPDSLLRLSNEQVLLRIAIMLPFDTVLPEEFAFRGVLLGALRRRHAALSAVVLAAIPFALWHAVLTGLETDSHDPVQFVGKLAADFVGGLVFGWLRVSTGHLAGGMLAHWLVDAGLMLGARALLRAQ